MSRLEAVFFDVDETLLDTPTTARAALQALFDDELDATALATWDAITEAQYARFNTGELDFPAMLTARMAQFLALRGAPHDETSARAFEQRRNEIFVENIAVFDDALPALQAARDRGLLLGVITNSEPNHQLRKLAAAGLADAFDAVIVSGAVGVAKPDPAIFTHACAVLGVAPAAALHVGDRLDTDALGARGAGLLGVWLDRLGVADGERRVPVVPSLADLDALVT